MPVNTVMSLAFSGKYCGVPWAASLAYVQLEADPDPPQTTGRQLVETWLNDDPGPWTHIRDFLSTEFTIECAVVRYDQVTETLLLQDVDGLAAGASWPSPFALQVETPGSDPHKADRGGRFYWPGFLITDLQGGSVTPTLAADLRTWMARLQQIDNSPGDFRYKLYPHFQYEAVGLGLAPPASLPFFHPFVKNIDSRRADDCTTFAAAGGGQFGPVQGPAPPV